MGLVVLGSIAAFIIMYGVVNQELDQGDGTYAVTAIFKDATGLAPQSKVMLAGIRVGEVSKIELIGDKAQVTINLQRRIELKQGLPKPRTVTERDDEGNTVEKERTYYKHGATVSKKQASLLGDYYLEVTPGLEGEVITENGSIMNVPEAVGPEALFERFDEIARDVKKVTESLANTFGSKEGQAALQDILKRLQEIAVTLSDFLNNNSGNLDRIVANAEDISVNVKGITRDARGDFKRILTDVKRITSEVNYIVNQSGSDVQDGLASLKTTLVRFSGTLDELNYTLQNMGEITDKINEGEGTLGVLVNDPAIATETEKAISGVGDFVNRLLQLQTIVELRSEFYVSQSALKNYVSVRLQPSPDKYYLIELVDDTRGSTRQIQETRLQTDPNEPPVVREDRVITTDDFKFSIQMARRWGFFTGRFGLIESSGGLGGDLHFLNDDLEVRFDVFDFGEDVNPRLRTSMAYSFLSSLYLIMGYDDILNDETRDFYFGAFLRFNDEDLAAVLSTAPAPSF